MKKKNRIAIAITSIFIMILVFTGCGSAASDKAAVEAYDGGYANDSYAVGMAGSYDMEESTEEYVEDGENFEGTDITSNPNLTSKKNVKLVYTANIYVQTLNYDESYKDLRKLVNDFGGYFESTQVSNGGYWSDGSYKSGSCTVRIPSDKYSEFINSVGNTYHVVDLSENVDDIGQAYYEAESHLETLKIKEERLQDLLKKADNMSDIIELEAALSETEYQLEQYNNTLERYDSMVDYSTVYLNMEQVTQYDSGVYEELGFFERIGQSLKNGAINFFEGLEDFLAWVGYNIIQIVIFVALIILAFRLHLGTLIKKILGRDGKPQKERKPRNRKRLFRKNKIVDEATEIPEKVNTEE